MPAPMPLFNPAVSGALCRGVKPVGLGAGNVPGGAGHDGNLAGEVKSLEVERHYVGCVGFSEGLKWRVI